MSSDFMFTLSVMLLTFSDEPNQSQATLDLSPYTVNGLSYSLTLRNEEHNPFVGAALPSYLGLFSISVLNSTLVDPAMQA